MAKRMGACEIHTKFEDPEVVFFDNVCSVADTVFSLGCSLICSKYSAFCFMFFNTKIKMVRQGKHFRLPTCLYYP